MRYDDELVTSHDKNQIPSTPVPAAANIPMLADGCDVVGIDEAQFFDDEIVKVCNDLANNGVRVIVAGLDMDFSRKSFWSYASLNGYGRNMLLKYMPFVHEQEGWHIIVLEPLKIILWFF